MRWRDSFNNPGYIWLGVALESQENKGHAKKRTGRVGLPPDDVRTSEEDGLKSIEYQNLVGLLIEAIKDQQKQIMI